MSRNLPHNQLPQPYPFLTKHSLRSFVTYYSYDHGAAAFCKILRIPHGFDFTPLHDMWVAKQQSTTGDPVIDFPTNIEGVMHSPLELLTGSSGGTLRDAYQCFTDKKYVYVRVAHRSATSGIYHVYFHIKLYQDTFEHAINRGINRTNQTVDSGGFK